MKYENIAFLQASDNLRTDLFNLGLEFILVKIDGKSQFMVVTNQLRLVTDLAIKHGITNFKTSDNRRQVFRLDMSPFFGVFESQKLGKLYKDHSKKGNPFLVVTEDNTVYHYIIK